MTEYCKHCRYGHGYTLGVNVWIVYLLECTYTYTMSGFIMQINSSYNKIGIKQLMLVVD